MRKMQNYLIFLSLVLAVTLLSSCEFSDLKLPFSGEETTGTESVETTAENSDSVESTEEKTLEQEEPVDTSDVHVGKDGDYEWEEYQPFS